MNRQQLSDAMSREDVLTELSALGEDPVASRVDAVFARLGNVSFSGSDRGAAMRNAVQRARSEVDMGQVAPDTLPAVVAGLSPAKRAVVEDAIAAGYSARYSDTCVDLVRHSAHAKPRLLRGLRIYANGSAFDATLDLSVAVAMRSAADMRAILGLPDRAAKKLSATASKHESADSPSP
ncbi:hypothetical protein R70006_05037 [Paraburkholderia domus]|uniref:hypothetical protein n=1 Tax=Paraburkholderia domus TaxID=2793075 RepID=UPI0019124C64|nr:hypothetical protein [Paraburkholderia domus]MBK5051726.1 hypothetical protein [Burkholderia sp. R-70006]CAE6795140.1 hypothetical protein R70006_05037 [Paraburkholderia domus]